MIIWMMKRKMRMMIVMMRLVSHFLSLGVKGEMGSTMEGVLTPDDDEFDDSHHDDDEFDDSHDDDDEFNDSHNTL